MKNLGIFRRSATQLPVTGEQVDSAPSPSKEKLRNSVSATRLSLPSKPGNADSRHRNLALSFKLQEKSQVSNGSSTATSSRSDLGSQSTGKSGGYEGRPLNQTKETIKKRVFSSQEELVANAVLRYSATVEPEPVATDSVESQLAKELAGSEGIIAANNLAAQLRNSRKTKTTSTLVKEVFHKARNTILTETLVAINNSIELEPENIRPQLSEQFATREKLSAQYSTTQKKTFDKLLSLTQPENKYFSGYKGIVNKSSPNEIPVFIRPTEAECAKRIALTPAITEMLKQISILKPERQKKLIDLVKHNFIDLSEDKVVGLSSQKERVIKAVLAHDSYETEDLLQTFARTLPALADARHPGEISKLQKDVIDVLVTLHDSMLPNEQKAIKLAVRDMGESLLAVYKAAIHAARTDSADPQKLNPVSDTPERTLNGSSKQAVSESSFDAELRLNSGSGLASIPEESSIADHVESEFAREAAPGNSLPALPVAAPLQGNAADPPKIPVRLTEKANAIDINKIALWDPVFAEYAKKVVSDATGGKISDRKTTQLDIKHLPLIVEMENARNPGLNLIRLNSPDEAKKLLSEMESSEFSGTCRMIFPPNMASRGHHFLLEAKLDRHDTSIIFFDSALPEIELWATKEIFKSNRRKISMVLPEIQKSTQDCVMYSVSFALKAHKLGFTDKLHGDVNEQVLSINERANLPAELMKHAQTRAVVSANSTHRNTIVSSTNKGHPKQESLESRLAAFHADRGPTKTSASIEGFRLQEIRRVGAYLEFKSDNSIDETFGPGHLKAQAFTMEIEKLSENIKEKQKIKATEIMQRRLSYAEDLIRLGKDSDDY